MYLIPILVGVKYNRPPLRVLAPINEVKEVLIHIRFNIVNCYRECAYMANSADPDENAASHLGLRYLLRLTFWIFLAYML